MERTNQEQMSSGPPDFCVQAHAAERGRRLERSGPFCVAIMRAGSGKKQRMGRSGQYRQFAARCSRSRALRTASKPRPSCCRWRRFGRASPRIWTPSSTSTGVRAARAIRIPASADVAGLFRAASVARRNHASAISLQNLLCSGSLIPRARRCAILQRICGSPVCVSMGRQPPGGNRRSCRTRDMRRELLPPRQTADGVRFA